MNPIRSRFATFLLLLGALLLALSEVVHPLFHHSPACGEAVQAVTETVLDTDSGHTALTPGLKFCPVCSGIFSAAEPLAAQPVIFANYPGFQTPLNAAEPDTAPYFRLRARVMIAYNISRKTPKSKAISAERQRCSKTRNSDC